MKNKDTIPTATLLKWVDSLQFLVGSGSYSSEFAAGAMAVLRRLSELIENQRNKPSI